MAIPIRTLSLFLSSKSTLHSWTCLALLAIQPVRVQHVQEPRSRDLRHTYIELGLRGPLLGSRVKCGSVRHDQHVHHSMPACIRYNVLLPLRLLPLVSLSFHPSWPGSCTSVTHTLAV